MMLELEEQLAAYGDFLDALQVDSSVATMRSARERRGRSAVVLVAACIAVIAVIAATWLVVDRGSSSHQRVSDQPPAVPSTRAGEDAAHLILTAPGWHITSAQDHPTRRVGEVVFSDDTTELTLSWYTVGNFEAEVAGRAQEATERTTTTINGATAQVFSGAHDSTAIWQSDGLILTTSSKLQDLDAFTTLLSSFEHVGIDRWLAALPDSVIRPTDRDTEIRSILADVPLPPGFDTKSIVNSGEVGDRTQLGIETTTAVTCGWFDAYFDAADSGDTAVASRAATALATSHNWAILNDMNVPGTNGFPQELWTYADAVNGGPGIGTGDGPVPVTRHRVHDGLGCPAPGH